MLVFTMNLYTSILYNLLSTELSISPDFLEYEV